MQHSKEVSIIFLKNCWWQKSMKFSEKKKICVNLFFVFFTNFKGIQGFYIKFQGSRSQYKFQPFQGFQGAVGTMYYLMPYHAPSWCAHTTLHTTAWSVRASPPTQKSNGYSLSGSDHVFWHSPSPCLHAYTTCIIPYKMFDYVGSITNHNPWQRYQWFITLATYWSHCDVTVMHVKFVSPLSFSFVKNSTETTSVLCPQVNIL